MNDRELIQEAGINSLPRRYRTIAEVIGFEQYLDLIEYYGGGFIYLPTVRMAFKEALYDKIFSEYDGTNRLHLMKKYDVSESTIRRIIQKELSDRSGKHERSKSDAGSGGQRNVAAGNGGKRLADAGGSGKRLASSGNSEQRAASARSPGDA